MLLQHTTKQEPPCCHIARDCSNGNFRDARDEWELWQSVDRYAFTGMVRF